MTKDEAIKKVLEEVERQHRLILDNYPEAKIEVHIFDAISLDVRVQGKSFTVFTKTLALGDLR